MLDHPNLLVVDDEEVICQACRRVFSRQGFQVEESTDARQGLSQAMEKDYAAILLDIKMPAMDGIEFLDELRASKPDVPVILITGYPSIPNAASAVRLGASDYVTKPFTPEEITQVVRRSLNRRYTKEKHQSASTPPRAEPWTLQSGEFRFLDESWFQTGREGTVRAGAMHQQFPEVPVPFDGSVCAGAVQTRPPEAATSLIRLPRPGEAVYQGLPLAGLRIAGKTTRTVPAPISGVVVAVNPLLREDLSALWNDPLGSGWIACISPTRIEEEVNKCKPRDLILVNADEASARSQREQLSALGCQVRVAKSGEELALAVEDPNYNLLIFDADSFGEQGPQMVGKVNAGAPSTRVVVVASSSCKWESAYRQQRIFYYAVEPFADGEIVEILNSAFRRQTQPLPREEREGASREPLSGIRITNRNGRKVHLLAGPGLLRRGDGLGGRILRGLSERTFPMVTTPGDAEITPGGVLKAAGSCDRVMVLLAKDTGRLAGSLTRDTKAEYVSASKENASRVTTLVVQPDSIEGGLAALDERTTAALAEHIVHEMASY